MGHTLADWHREAAEMAFGARTAHDRMISNGRGREREDAVTVWRRTAHVLNEYANGQPWDTWEAFWGEAMSRDAYLRLIERRSRFNRCDENGEAVTVRDSVADWERSLAHAITASEKRAAYAHRVGLEEPTRRTELELSVDLSIAAAYTGCSLDDLRTALRDCDGQDPDYGDPTGHPLFELITANRPTV